MQERLLHAKAAIAYTMAALNYSALSDVSAAPLSFIF